MKSYIIGIAGGSGSGKTTFLRELKEGFPPEQVCFLPMDNYYRPSTEQLPDEKGVLNFDLPQSIDREAFLNDLMELMAGRTVERVEYTYNNPAAVEKMQVIQSAPVILVEGIFVFHYPEINALLDLKVFLHAKENLSLIRRIKRDQVERGYPIEQVLYQFQHHVQPAFEQFILPYKEDADIIINNNSHFQNALDVLRAFIKVKSEG